MINKLFVAALKTLLLLIQYFCHPLFKNQKITILLNGPNSLEEALR